MLLVPIGFGIIIGNIPTVTGHGIGIYEEGSVLNYLYFGVRYGVYPPLIFLGVGAMTDFSSLISNPKLMLIGAAAQIGIFAAYMGALALGFPANEAGSIAIIGGADGPTAIFLTSRLAPEYMGAIAICAYSYMALVPVIQPPVMRLLTSQRERLIKMRPPRAVSSTEKILFPIIGFLLTTFVVPDALPAAGYALLGQPSEGVGRGKASGHYGQQPADRHHDDPDRHHGGSFDAGVGFLDPQDAGHPSCWAHARSSSPRWAACCSSS